MSFAVTWICPNCLAQNSPGDARCTLCTVKRPPAGGGYQLPPMQYQDENMIRPVAAEPKAPTGSFNAYPSYLAIIIGGQPVQIGWTAEQRRHLMADLAEIVACDLRSSQ
jgi:hypothetical protein